jgi:sec-independent protein translocase protein TatA
MPFRLGPTELIIILVIIILLFGVGRIGKVAGELGSGLRAFREGLRGDDDKDKDKEKAVQEEKKDSDTKAE